MRDARLQRAGSSWSKYLSRQTFVGTPNYMAPEIMVQSEEGYNQSAGEPPCTIALSHVTMQTPDTVHLLECSCKAEHNVCTGACSTHACASGMVRKCPKLGCMPSMLTCTCILQTSGPLGWCCWSWQEAKCPWRAAPSPRSSWTLCTAMRPACRRAAAHTNTQK